jgi:hypothetical protein
MSLIYIFLIPHHLSVWGRRKAQDSSALGFSRAHFKHGYGIQLVQVKGLSGWSRSSLTSLIPFGKRSSVRSLSLGGCCCCGRGAAVIMECNNNLTSRPLWWGGLAARCPFFLCNFTSGCALAAWRKKAGVTLLILPNIQAYIEAGEIITQKSLLAYVYGFCTYLYKQ